MEEKQEGSTGLEWGPRKWVIPPGLNRSLYSFAIRCNLIIEDFLESKSRPLLIYGPTGVGKSVFCEYFVYEFRKKIKNKKVLFVNCAALPGTLIESELFGYEKGAHSEAGKRKIGYFEIIEDGVIVLEEIGEMPKHIQAKLLMVIENKIFSRLGSTENLPFKAQIVATSNVDKKKFRRDFIYRFNTFSIPPIHERRGDILYYINHTHPGLIKILSKGAVLSLLSYNWPGNVREIEHVCNAVLENIIEMQDTQNYWEDLLEAKSKTNVLTNQKQIMQINYEFSDFKFDKALDASNKLQKSNINIEKIENVLQSNLLSFDPYVARFYQGEGLFDSEVEDNEGKSYFRLETNELFDLAYNGFLVFCKLFFQDELSNNDILDLNEFVQYEGGDTEESNTIFKEDFGEIIENGYDVHKIKFSEDKNIIMIYHNAVCISIYYSDINCNAFWPMRYRTALIESLKYVSGLNSIDLDDINDLNLLHEKNKENIFLRNYFKIQNANSEPEEIPIEDIAYSDIKELYYETLCSKIGLKHGSQKRIAEIAKFSTGTISQDFAELKIKEKFSNPNFPPRKRLIFLE